MIVWATLKELDKNLGGEVILAVKGQELRCFARHLPYGVTRDSSYQVEIFGTVYGNYRVKEANDAPPSITYAENSFACQLVGSLSDGRLDCGVLSLHDETLLSEFGYLNGKTVAWTVDRIDIEFV